MDLLSCFAPIGSSLTEFVHRHVMILILRHLTSHLELGGGVLDDIDWAGTSQRGE